MINITDRSGLMDTMQEVQNSSTNTVRSYKHCLLTRFHTNTARFSSNYSKQIIKKYEHIQFKKRFTYAITAIEQCPMLCKFNQLNLSLNHTIITQPNIYAQRIVYEILKLCQNYKCGQLLLVQEKKQTQFGFEVQGLDLSNKFELEKVYDQVNEILTRQIVPKGNINLLKKKYLPFENKQKFILSIGFTKGQRYLIHQPNSQTQHIHLQKKQTQGTDYIYQRLQEDWRKNRKKNKNKENNELQKFTDSWEMRDTNIKFEPAHVPKYMPFYSEINNFHRMITYRLVKKQKLKNFLDELKKHGIKPDIIEQNYSKAFQFQHFKKHPFILVGIDANKNENLRKQIEKIKQKMGFGSVYNIGGSYFKVKGLNNNENYGIREEFRNLFLNQFKLDPWQTEVQTNDVIYRLDSKLRHRRRYICFFLGFYLTRGFIIQKKC